MHNFNFDNHFQEHNRHSGPGNSDLSLDKDLVMEHILKNLNTTPIGQVLKKIAKLPEVRQDKVLDVRQALTGGNYDLNGRLDDALERVLEDLTL